jgi:hypothetical protein
MERRSTTCKSLTCDEDVTTATIRLFTELLQLLIDWVVLNVSTVDFGFQI